jgi:FtsH-binding integral membrane protein
MKTNENTGRLILGAVLVLLGIFFMFGQVLSQVFDIRIGHYTWPFIILLPGVVLYLLAFITSGEGSKALAIIGSIITAVGGLLFFQNVTNAYATWAYAWAFVFPTSAGLGLALLGLLRRQDELVRSGWGLAKVGLIILAVGFAFFELLIGVSGFRFFGLRAFCFPAFLIFAGVLFIFYNLLPGRKSAQPARAVVEPTAPVVEPPARPENPAA